jgi:hypothetical protein
MTGREKNRRGRDDPHHDLHSSGSHTGLSISPKTSSDSEMREPSSPRHTDRDTVHKGQAAREESGDSADSQSNDT